MHARFQMMCALVILTLVYTGGLPASASPWTSAPSLNIPRQHFSASIDNDGNILAIGGWNRTGGCSSTGGPVLDTVEMLRFDGQGYSNQWELTAIVLPVPRYFHTSVISDGYLYVLGGLHQVGSPPWSIVATVDRYDLAAGTWSQTSVPPLPQATIDGAAIADAAGRIWYMGGQVSPSPNVYTNRVDIFDPARPELGWQVGPSLNTARSRFTAVAEDECSIYAIGGYTDANQLRSVEHVDACGSGAWALLGELLPLPANLEAQASLGADGQIYVAGGWSDNYYVDRVLRRARSTGVWESVFPLTVARAAHRVVTGRDGYVYALGGSVPGCNSTTSVEKMRSSTCDDFEDASIDPTRWGVGGFDDRGVGGGAWDYEHVESNGALATHVWGPLSGSSHGAEAWVRQTFDYNDRRSHVINFEWAFDVNAWHVDMYAVQITDGTVPDGPDVYWYGSQDGETDGLGWKNLYFKWQQPDQAGAAWSILVDSAAATATLFDGPSLTGQIRGQKSLPTGQPWFVRFILSDATSAGFPAGDNWLYLLDYCSTAEELSIGDVDCNANGLADVCDIGCGGVGGDCDRLGCGQSSDCDGNGRPDECEEDFDADGQIDPCDPDIDDDGVPNEEDACNFTPHGALVITEGCLRGTLRFDADGDCDVDLADFARFAEEMTGPG